LRAVFELAKHRGNGPTKISDIADAQSIPLRFLEVILNQLKGSGLINAKRGFYGGYYLTRPPEHITVADIMSFMQARRARLAQCAACKARLNATTELLRVHGDVEPVDHTICRCTPKPRSGPAGQ
jgi:Rrf2 family protein